MKSVFIFIQNSIQQYSSYCEWVIQSLLNPACDKILYAIIEISNRSSQKQQEVKFIY